MKMLDLTVEAFNHLTIKQQVVWILKMQQGLTEKTTAKLLGISRDAVHNRLLKARFRYTRYIQRIQRKEANYV
jgi:DNA-directed RNA polymerase specialized sigma24 family protein